MKSGEKKYDVKIKLWKKSKLLYSEGAPWSPLSWENFQGFCSTGRCWFTASLSVSHPFFRGEIINLSELLLTLASVSAAKTHAGNQERRCKFL